MARRICRVRSGEEARRILVPVLRGGREVLIIAPTRAAADELTWSIEGGALGLHRLTLLQLAAQMAASEMASRGLAPMSRLTAEALATRAVHELRRDKKLKYFLPVSDTPGFIQAVTKTLRELRLQQIPATKLSRAGAGGRDLAALLRRFTALAEEFRLADESLLFELATGVNESPFLGLPLVLLDVPVWYRSHGQLLERLVKASLDVTAVIADADTDSVQVLEETLGVQAEPSSDAPSARISHMRAQLFSAETRQPPTDDGSVDFFAAPGESFECVEITRRLLELAHNGTPFDRVAILLRQPERYQPFLEDALRRAGIPAYFTRGTRRPDPAGRAFLALLSCAAEKLSATRFAEYLSLAQVPSPSPSEQFVPPSDETAAAIAPTEDIALDQLDAAPAPAAPFQWERLLVDAAVIGGADRWERRLAGLHEELRLQVGAADDEEAGRREAIQRRLEQLNALAAFALPVIHFLDDLPQSATWEEWLPRLEELARLTLRFPDGVLSLLAELWPLGNVGPLAVSEVRSVLEDRLRTLREEPPRRRYGCVLVASIEEARGRRFDVVFVPGLGESLFPQKAMEDPLLLDESRRRIDPLLARREMLTQRERLLLRIASGAGSRVIFSYPTMDSSIGRGRVPSLYALEVERARTGALPSLRQFEQQTRTGCLSRLGWPAPRDPYTAIDDTEYDLAVLGGLERRQGASARGVLRFLIESNANAARSLRVRHKRWESRKWTDADGLAQLDPHRISLLEPYRLTASAYAPTTLQHYAACPYRFFLAGVIRLRPRDTIEAIEQLDPLTRGEIFHSVQFRLLTALRAGGLLPLIKSRLPEAVALADQVLDKAAAEYAELLAPAIEPVWASEMESIRTDLRGWLRDSANSGWTPEHFELRFGLRLDPASDDTSTDQEIVLDEGFRLRGAIDLIERKTGASDLRVVDHKTGKALDDRNRPLLATGGGEVLQPLLYGLAAEKLLNQNVKQGELYYCTQRGGFGRRVVLFDPANRNRGTALLGLIDDSVAKGNLPSAPRKDACTFCDYRVICGPHEELRIRAKPLKELAALIEVRAQR